MVVLKTHKSFGGTVQFWEHNSASTKTKMKFSTYIPEGKVKGCLIWLSGLTCTDENFISKAGAQKYLSDHKLMVICPDTSPRGLDLPKEHESWDFGSGASFYVDATTPGYKDHYQMYSYITQDIYSLIQNTFKIQNISIMGHSMGGHGALTIGLKEASKFKSISAFSPIVNPVECPWGLKAFKGYFGGELKSWISHDASELLKSGLAHENPILIDQGTEDSFLEKELLTDNIVKANSAKKQILNLRYQEGYDHSYYFIASFIKDHIEFHSRYI